MYNLEDLSRDLGAQIKAIKDSKDGIDADNAVKKGKAIAELSKNVVEIYKTKASVLKLLDKDATPVQMRNLIASSGLAPQLTETGNSGDKLIEL